MASYTQGIGLLTANYIVAVMRAVPETNGTHATVTERARE